MKAFYVIWDDGYLRVSRRNLKRHPDAVIVRRFTGRQWVDVNPSPAPPAPELVCLNTATEEELCELPTVGVVTARRIIEARPIESIDDLPVGDAVLAAISGLVKL